MNNHDLARTLSSESARGDEEDCYHSSRRWCEGQNSIVIDSPGAVEWRTAETGNRPH